MTACSFRDIVKTYDSHAVLKGACGSLSPGDRVGLVGINGSGKSTLLRILSGRERPDSGSVALARGAGVGYLEQSPSLSPGTTVMEYVKSAFDEIARMEQALHEMETLMGAGVHDEEALAGLMDEYARTRTAFEEMGGYTRDARAATALNGLGVSEAVWKQDLASLSGGERTRIALAHLLCRNPEILLLDEPTNHLDLAARGWLEQFLRDYRGGVLIVSHDRYFLDHVARSIWELSDGAITVFGGNYSAYRLEKAVIEQRQQKQYASFERIQARREETIRRMRQWAAQADNPAMFKRAAALQKTVDRDRQNNPAPITDSRKTDWSVSMEHRSGQIVLDADGLSFKFMDSDAPLLSAVTFQLRYGEHVALIGPNGAGKTTLLRLALGEMDGFDGRLTFGARVRPAYYAQRQEDIAPDKTLLDWALDGTGWNPAAVRNWLAKNGYRGESVFRRLCELSGGERSRLALGLMAHSGANLLILDEPTNHLDLPGLEALETLIQDFEGTVLLVSHDRYLMNTAASRILELTPSGMRSYPGNYDNYLEARQRVETPSVRPSGKTAQPAKKKTDTPGSRPKVSNAALSLQSLESDIASLEQEAVAIEQSMYHPEASRDPGRLSALSGELEALRNRIDELYRQWATLAEQS